MSLLDKLDAHTQQHMQQKLQHTVDWCELTVKFPYSCGQIQEWHSLFYGVLNVSHLED